MYTEPRTKEREINKFISLIRKDRITVTNL